MIAYRICSPAFSNDISGTGARLYGGRWNSAGVPMLYLAASISLACLEMLVHLQHGDTSNEFALLYISIPEDAGLQQLRQDKLKPGWPDDPGYTRFIGDEFILQKQKLVMQVPSAVVDEESNYLLNPLHPAFKKTVIQKIKIFQFDQRLFKLT